MITIYKNKKDIPDNMDYVELNDVFFNQNTGSKLDDRAKVIVEKIDNSRLVGKYKIESKVQWCNIRCRLSVNWL